MLVNNRNSGIELLRIILMFGIILMHTITTKVSEPIYIWINVLGSTGVTCFILISGYYGIHLKTKKLLQLDIRFIVFSLLTLVVMVWGGNTVGLKAIVSGVFPIISHKSWFLSCYVFLNILSPFLNEFIETMPRARMKAFILTGSALFLLIPTIFGFDLMGFGGKDLAHVILTYFIGRYIRLYADERMKNIKHPGYLFVLVCIINFLLNYSFYMITHTVNCYYSRDNSILIMVQAILLFYIFQNIKIKSKVVNYMAKGVLSMHMLETFATYVILFVWDYSSYEGGKWWVLVAMLVVVSKMFLAFGISEIYKLLFAKLEKYGIGFVNGRIERVLNFVRIKMIYE